MNQVRPMSSLVSGPTRSRAPDKDKIIDTLRPLKSPSSKDHIFEAIKASLEGHPELRVEATDPPEQ